MPLVKQTEEPKPFMNQSFKISATAENLEILKQARLMAAKDGWSLSRLIRTALEEYVQRHSPGNPQLHLGHWSENDPLPETVLEEGRRRDTYGNEWEKKEDGAWYRIPRSNPGK